MKQLLRPNPVRVEVPDKYGWESNHDVNMETWLFRAGCFVPEALDFAMQRVPGSKPLSVKVMACSVGAEADDLAALHKASGTEGEMSVTGYDINQLAVAAARRGLYTVHEDDKLDPQDQEEALRGLGFDTWWEPGRRTDGSFQPRLKVDATSLREGYDIAFAEHDMLEPLADAELADLVLANNWRYYMDPQSATQVIRNLAETLADNGVLSLGATTLGGLTPWTDHTVALLDEEFDLKPRFATHLGNSPDLVPVMFARV